MDHARPAGLSAGFAEISRASAFRHRDDIRKENTDCESTGRIRNGPAYRPGQYGQQPALDWQEERRYPLPTVTNPLSSFRDYTDSHPINRSTIKQGADNGRLAFG